MPWRNCVAVGRAYLLLRADLLEQFAEAQKELGYRYCRFHALFDRDMDVVERAKDGSLTFKWHQIDKIYDALLAMGIRPFVELNPMPDALASGTQQLFWYKANVTPPQDYREWELLVHEFAKHLVRRYDGELDTRSKLGEGSTFTVYLPILREKANADREA